MLYIKRVALLTILLPFGRHVLDLLWQGLDNFGKKFLRPIVVQIECNLVSNCCRGLIFVCLSTCQKNNAEP
jgi:hypothetical protein